MTDFSDNDQRWLDSAVRLARPRLGTTAGHPAAAVLVVDAGGRLLGRGITGDGGRPSAQAAALADARGLTEDATAYLTLEPEAGTGGLASEAEKLVEAGLSRAVIGMLHPDKALRGRGVAALRQRGMSVVTVDDEACRDLNAAFAMRVGRRRPHVTVVMTLSRDGMIGRREGGAAVEPDGEAARWIAFERAFTDAVVTSARAAHLHLPDLDIRIAGLERPRQQRVIIEGTTPFAPPADWDATGSIVLHAQNQSHVRLSTAEYVAVEARNGRPDLRRALAALAERGISAVQVRSGARLTEALLGAELVDRLHLVDVDIELGRAGMPATPLGTLDGRLRAAGFVATAETIIGDCRLRSFEPRL